MIFKGSPKFKSYLDISKTFDANGISFNAFTGKDVTAYHFKFLSTSENVDIICKITSDMIMFPLMRDKDILTERNVIIQEMKDDEDDVPENCMLCNLNDRYETNLCEYHRCTDNSQPKPRHLKIIRHDGHRILKHMVYYEKPDNNIVFERSIDYLY